MANSKHGSPEKPHLRPPEPATIVIFGASGDLTRRKLMPALYSLYGKDRLPDRFSVVGFARSEFSHTNFRSEMAQAIRQHSDVSVTGSDWEAFARNLFYQPGNFENEDDFGKLEALLAEQEQRLDTSNRVYYLAVAPRFYETIVSRLGEHDMVDTASGWRRIVIEKPFGHDLRSAQALNRAVHKRFDERQVYRIDHYLGKETAQNILFFRFANAIFEPVWNRRYIDHVQISVVEAVDVGQRAGYYDQAGVVRDMFQNHLLQLLSLVTLEPPVSFEANALRNEKVKVLEAIRPIDLDDTVRAQYEGYHDTPGVEPDSETATYAAMKLYIDNWRWRGVPFYLRSGKALAKKTSEIIIEFECPPHLMFDFDEAYSLTPNILSLCIQPDEGIHLKFETKVPDSIQTTASVDMEFHYRSSFTDKPLPGAYERLLLDVLQGDAALFTRNDEIELAWSLIDPVLQGWHTTAAPPLVTYKPGSWGPAAAEKLLRQDGRDWQLGCGGHATDTVSI